MVPILTPVKTPASTSSANGATAGPRAAHVGDTELPAATPPAYAHAATSGSCALATTPLAMPSTQRRATAREEAEEVKHSDFEPARRQLRLDGSSPLAALSPEVVALNKQTYLDSNEFKVRHCGPSLRVTPCHSP